LTTFSTSIVCSSLNPSANWLTQVCLGVVGLAYIATIASGLLLAVAVSNDWRAGVVLGLLTVAPCVGMFVLGGICQYAFHLLKQGGLRLTLFGTERQ
jgi:malonyl CoA-acyl carrier protein transacylase